MQAFIMHVGHPGDIDIGYTVTRKRTVGELTSSLPPNAPERSYFANDPQLHAAFPTGEFNCWGLPSRAKPSFDKTHPGDLVLIVPWIGVHNGGVHQLGIVKATCPVRALSASQVLWPNTPYERLFPLLFFFDTEVGHRSWYSFLEDMGYAQNWNPKGWYRRIQQDRFSTWGGPGGYLTFLREGGKRGQDSFIGPGLLLLCRRRLLRRFPNSPALTENCDASTPACG